MWTGDGEPETVGPVCPIRVRRPSMIHRWDQLTFLHWSYDPEVVQRLLPDGLVVDTFDDRAWVALVPFVMEVRPPKGPALPWISRFCETNVRTYATAADGTRGVWFLSLDAARLPAVLTARSLYRLPYLWSAMTFDREDDVVTYTCRRRWPGPRGASSSVRIRIGEPFQPAELTDRDHFLTARWRLYSPRRGGPHAALAEHPPWPLHRVEVLDLDDELLRAGGLPEPEGEPLCHWSPGVEVRIGTPRRVPGRPAGR